MPPSLLGEAAPDFSDPIGMLEACHRRIVQNCELLQRMCDHQEARRIDGDLAAAANRVLRYFELAAPQHHADEEHDLFPALQNQTDLLPLIGRLRSEHTGQEELWRVLREDLLTISKGGNSPTLREHSAPFVRACLEHVQLENTDILPRARGVLDGPTLKRIGRAMQQRRAHQQAPE